MILRYGFPHIFFALMWAFAMTGWAAEIEVAVDRNPVSLNESFQVTFTAHGAPDAAPDFAPLQDHFEVISQQRSSSSSWVNGQSSRSEQWILRAMAKQAGEAEIPAIAFGADRSKPLSLRVNQNTGTVQNKNEDIFLEVTATPEQPYVQSQVLYTLKLLRKVQITQASLSDPEIKEALVEKLGEDSNYTTQISGVDYWVTERKYAIFPQQSGVFTIAPLVLNAEYISDQQQPRFNGFFNRPSTETRRLLSKAITLNVLAVPANFQNPNWLSAERLTLSETWSDTSLQTKVGEPLTRTLTLSAKGATVGQLPELLSKVQIDGIKTYPDQPMLKEDKQSDGLTAVREEKIAFIPPKPGDYELPALDVVWFNTKTQKVETAHLPSVKIKAIAGVETSEAAASPQSVTESVDAKQTGAAPIPIAESSAADTRFWQAVSAVLALGWLLTGVWLYRRPAPNTLVARTDGLRPDAAVEKNLRGACRDNNPQAAKQALLQWGKAEFAAENLGAIAAHSPGALGDEILLLNRLLYSGQHQDWQGQALWLAFNSRSSTPKTHRPAQDGLEPLFKI